MTAVLPDLRLRRYKSAGRAAYYNSVHAHVCCTCVHVCADISIDLRCVWLQSASLGVAAEAPAPATARTTRPAAAGNATGGRANVAIPSGTVAATGSTGRRLASAYFGSGEPAPVLVAGADSAQLQVGALAPHLTSVIVLRMGFRQHPILFGMRNGSL